MKKFIGAFLLVFLIAAAQASELKFDHGRIVALIQWIKGPQLMDESTLELKWVDSVSGRPVPAPGVFSVTIDMPEMPMNNPPTTVAPLQDENGQMLLGDYQVSGIYFSMGGVWNVNVKLNLPTKTTETQSLSLTVNDTP